MSNEARPTFAIYERRQTTGQAPADGQAAFPA